MIKINNLSFSYDNKQKFEKIIFKNNDLEITNKKTLLVGPSGSGKSTFFKLLIDYIIPSAGSIEKPLDTCLVLQNINTQIISSSIYDEINLGYKNKFNENIGVAEIKNFFDIFAVDFPLDKNPNNLSVGQKKIVIIISSICTSPELLILDEPFVGLDRKRRDALCKYLKETNIPFILSTHDIEDNFDIYDNVVSIFKQKIQQTTLDAAIEDSFIKRPGGYNA